MTLASIGDGVITTDAEGKVTFLNPVAEALTGWSQDGGACGTPLATVFQIVHEQTRQPVENPVARVMREGRIVGLANHTVLIARDGTERPIDDSAAPIRDAEGNVAGVVLVFRDVTEHRRAEQADRKNKEDPATRSPDRENRPLGVELADRREQVVAGNRGVVRLSARRLRGRLRRLGQVAPSRRLAQSGGRRAACAGNGASISRNSV